MRQILAIGNTHSNSNIDKQVVRYHIIKRSIPCELPYIVHLYNKDNYCLFSGAFRDKETAISYAHDQIDMTTPF